MSAENLPIRTKSDAAVNRPVGTKENVSVADGDRILFDSQRIRRAIEEVAGYYRAPVCFVALESETEIHLKGRLGVSYLSVPNPMDKPSIAWHRVKRPLPIIIEDVGSDKRFVNDPLCAGPPKLQFYAGAPLMVEPDVCIGSLCIMGITPDADFGLKESEYLMAAADTIVQVYRNAKLPGNPWSYTIGTLPGMNSNTECAAGFVSNTVSSLPSLLAEKSLTSLPELGEWMKELPESEDEDTA